MVYSKTVYLYSVNILHSSYTPERVLQRRHAGGRRELFLFTFDFFFVPRMAAVSPDSPRPTCITFFISASTPPLQPGSIASSVRCHQQDFILEPSILWISDSRERSALWPCVSVLLLLFFFLLLLLLLPLVTQQNKINGAVKGRMHF